MKSNGRYILFALAFILPGLVTRFMSMRNMDLVPKGIDYLGGGITTLGVGLVFCAIACSVRSKLWSFFWLILLLCMEHANTEHLIDLGSSVQLIYVKFLFSGAFFKGSAANISHPEILFALCASGIIPFIFGRRLPMDKKLLAKVSLTGVLISLPFAMLGNSKYPTWRKTHFVVENILTQLIWLATPVESNDALALETPRSVHPDVTDIFAPDLNGEPFFQADGKNPNVILILLEGVSGAFFPKLAGKFADKHLSLKKLDNLTAAKGTAFGNFINHNRKTNRGLFSLLCGEHPNYLSGYRPKLESYIDDPKSKKCLPEILREVGYQTKFIQGSDLTFMKKNLFAPAAGFSEYLGKAWFHHPRLTSGWGVDDKTLFDGVTTQIDSLSDADKPWFMTVLTVGTHHPYSLVPRDWRPSEKKSDKVERSFSYLDEAVTNFIIQQLKKAPANGRETLILVSSDESHYSKQKSPLKRDLSQHWGFLFAFRAENQQPQKISTLVQQADMSISILDYVGHPKLGTAFLGRSYFRSYKDNSRNFYMGNSNSGRLWHIQDKELLSCHKNFRNCETYTFDGPAPFTSTQLVKKNTPHAIVVDKFKKFLRANEVTRGFAAAPGKYIVHEPGKIKIGNNGSKIDVIYRWFSYIPSGWEADYHLKFKVLEGELTIHSTLRSNSKRTGEILAGFDHRLIKKGDTYETIIAYELSADTKEVIAVLNAKNSGKKHAIIDIQSAFIELKAKAPRKAGTIHKEESITHAEFN